MAFAIGMCSAQPDAQARLTCFDQLAGKLRAGVAIVPQASASATPQSAPTYTPTPAAQTPAAPTQTPAQAFGQPAPETSKEKSSWYDVGGWFGGDDAPRVTTGTPAEFGAESVPAPKATPGNPPPPQRLDHFSAKVASVAFSGTGRFTVTLDNGQMWKQIDADTGTARFSKNGEDSVTISRGILGSYNLVVEGHAALFKVRRIR